MSDSYSAVGGAPVRTLSGVQILATGSFVPDNVVTNADLSSLGCDPEWIVQRTGIRERRHAPPGMTTSDMAVAAAERCLAAANVDRSEIDLLVLGTMTPDRLLPATATRVQTRLGLQCGAIDVNAACAGFTYALTTAMQFVATGCSKKALVIGADANSRAIDPTDVKTYPLFGDGADGSGMELLHRPVGGAESPYQIGVEPNSWLLKMDGRPVFKWAVRLVEETTRQVLEASGLSTEQIDCWLFHQANVRILDAAIEALEINRERVVMHMDRYGNTSAGSIPIALDETVRAGGIRRGDHLLMSGFGAGLAWGTIVWRW